MSFEIQTTSYFDTEAKRLAKRHRSFTRDLQDFRDSIMKNPYQGTEMSPGIRKIRLTIDSKGRGKSGGARVITFTYLVNEKDGVVILLLLYDKADASSIKMNVVRKIIKDLGLDIETLQKEGLLKVSVQNPAQDTEQDLNQQIQIRQISWYSRSIRWKLLIDCAELTGIFAFPPSKIQCLRACFPKKNGYPLCFSPSFL